MNRLERRHLQDLRHRISDRDLRDAMTEARQETAARLVSSTTIRSNR